jgi:hypothetical protein
VNNKNIRVLEYKDQLEQKTTLTCYYYYYYTSIQNFIFLLVLILLQIIDIYYVVVLWYEGFNFTGLSKGRVEVERQKIGRTNVI